MSLTPEDGTGLAAADSYASLVAARAYMAAMGYAGSFTAIAAPKVNGALDEGATSMNVDGGSGEETLLAGDLFMFTGGSGFHAISKAAYGQSGALAGVEFSPAAPAAVANDAALIFRSLTEEQVRRGARTLDALYEARLQGYRASETQALAWPRTGVETVPDGFTIATTTIPTRWIHASIELARVCPSDQGMDFPAWLTAVSAGSVDVAGGLTVRTVISLVRELIRPYVGADLARVRRAV